MYVVKEVQRVYRNTGVYINDKHIEVIIRQMLRRVKVDEPGDTEMLPNDLVDRFVYADINARVLAEGGEPATAQTYFLVLRRLHSILIVSWRLHLSRRLHVC